MARTVGAPDPATINDAASWQFYTGGHGAGATWSGSLADARPLVELGVNIGEVRTTSTLRDSFELALRAVGVDRGLLGTNGPAKS